MKLERIAAVVVLMGGVVWDGFNHGNVDTLVNRRVAMRNAVRQYDPFQFAPRDLELPIEVLGMISCENDAAIDALPSRVPIREQSLARA